MGDNTKFRVPVEKILEIYERNGRNMSATSRETGLTRATVRYHIKKAGHAKKPIAAGSVTGTEARVAALPPQGRVNRYILTSAQNNTYVHEKVWSALLALAEHYGATILVGTYSYNQNAYGPLSVKRTKDGKKKPKETEPWYAEKLMPYLSDERMQLGNGLVWCGEMNILPTAVDPLAGLESYSGRDSAIFPHAKLAMRSIPTMQTEGTKLNYTTGTVTKRNYIQKRAGLIAEHHHIYGGLLVEVNHDGNWWVRQLNAEDDGTLYDLDVRVKDGKVTTGHRVEAITWGDIHATIIDPSVRNLSVNILDALRPKNQFMHDILEGVAINHHSFKDPHTGFKSYNRGLSTFTNELCLTRDTIVDYYDRPNTAMFVVYSNHDTPWVLRWLREHDYRRDPANATLFLDCQRAVYRAIEESNEKFNVLEHALHSIGFPKHVRFLGRDESYTICGTKIECGMHGHLGPNGRHGAPGNLYAMSRKANTAHTHSAGIYNGLYVAGTSTKLRWDYAQGPSSWTHSHIVTYPNGKRTIITLYAGKWRASES